MKNIRSWLVSVGVWVLSLFFAVTSIQAQTPAVVVEDDISVDTADFQKKMVDAFRRLKGKKPVSLGKTFDITEVLRDLIEAINEVAYYERQWYRGEITEEERDLKQGVAVARVVGWYGGKVVGGIIGLKLGGLSLNPAGAVIGVFVGQYAGGFVGQTVAWHVAHRCAPLTRMVVRTVRRVIVAATQPFSRTRRSYA